jgi:hypothetical protein
MMRSRLGVLVYMAQACREVRRSDWRWSKSVRNPNDIVAVGCFAKDGERAFGATGTTGSASPEGQ